MIGWAFFKILGSEEAIIGLVFQVKHQSLEGGKKIMVRLILGSESDAEKGNIFLKVLEEVGVECRVSIASCHRNIGGEFEQTIFGISEEIIVMLGGMELAAPGIIESLLRNAENFDSIVFGIPTDRAARSAIENLPKGTAIITSGLNEISVTHSIINSALAVAKLVGMLGKKGAVEDGLRAWYKKNSKPVVLDVKLDENSLIIINEV